MKKIIFTRLLTSIFAVSMFATSTALANDDIYVTVNGENVNWTDAKPIVHNDRTLVPLRAVAEALGLQVDWSDESQCATFTGKRADYDIWNVSFYIDDPFYSFGGYNIGDANAGGGDAMMDTCPIIVNGRTYAPIRYLAESFDYSVNWNDNTNTVVITSAQGE